MGLDVTLTRVQKTPVFESKITHNLSGMAKEAGIYWCIWRPEEADVVEAYQLIPHLREGLALLLSEPDRFKKFNPANGWGDYYTLVGFVQEYLKACEDNACADVEVSR